MKMAVSCKMKHGVKPELNAEQESKPYTVNRFWQKKLKRDKILITTHHGQWLILSQREFELLLFNRIQENPDLFKRLEEHGVIITEDNKNKIVDEYKKRFSPLFNGTNLHVISPTLRCNHSCIYCHAKSVPIDAKGYDMDEETAKDVVDFIFQSPSRSLRIEFQGGEPLAVFPIVQYIVEYSNELNKEAKKHVEYNIVSNLTLMDDDILDWLVKNKVRICTSLDGPKELHDKNRKFLGARGSYDKVVHWIKKVKEKQGSISALPTITKYSLAYHKEIVDEYLKNGINHLRPRPMNCAGLAAETWKKIGYSGDEFLEFWKKTVDYIIELNRKGKWVWEETVAFVLRKILDKDYMSYTCFGSPCGAALQQSAYNYLGDVYTCDEARSFEIFKLGNVKENSYRDIYASPHALNIIGISSQVSSLCDVCVWHPFCGPCPVSTYGSQGNLISKLPLDRECRIRGGELEYIFKKLVSPDRKILLKWMEKIKL